MREAAWLRGRAARRAAAAWRAMQSGPATPARRRPAARRRCRHQRARRRAPTGALRREAQQSTCTQVRKSTRQRSAGQHSGAHAQSACAAVRRPSGSRRSSARSRSLAPSLTSRHASSFDEDDDVVGDKNGRGAPKMAAYVPASVLAAKGSVPDSSTCSSTPQLQLTWRWCERKQSAHK
jgi:hypothetical protein